MFAYSIIGLTSALYSFKNTSQFKSTKALFIHARTQLASRLLQMFADENLDNMQSKVTPKSLW